MLNCRLPFPLFFFGSTVFFRNPAGSLVCSVLNNILFLGNMNQMFNNIISRNPTGSLVYSVLKNILILENMNQMFNNIISRNPAGSLVCSVLNNILILGKSMNQMFDPVMKSKLSPGFSKVFDLLEVDKNNILGLPGSRYTPFLSLKGL